MSESRKAQALGARASLSTRTFIERFFAHPNDILNSEIREGGKSASLLPWVAPLFEAGGGWTVLPCRRGNELHWYALAFDDSQLATLSEDLLAVIGPTYSDFRGLRCTLKLQDPIEAAVAELTGGRAFRFRGSDTSDDKKIWERLELLRSMGPRRRNSPSEPPRPAGRVFRDFEMALLAGDADSAAAELAYLRAHQFLSPLNLLFLRVRLLATFGRWEELLASPELPDLIQMRRPVAVTEAFLRAIYRTRLMAFEQSGDLQGIVAHFREKVLPRYGGLFGRRIGLRAPDALKIMMLVAVAGSPTDPTLRDSLRASQGLQDSEKEFLAQLAGLLKGEAETDSAIDHLAAAQVAEERGDYDRAFTIGRDAPRGVKRTQLLVRIALELQVLEAKALALDAFASLTTEERNECLRPRMLRAAYDALSREAAGRTDQQAVDGNGVEPPVGAMLLLPRNLAEWVEWAVEAADPLMASEVARAGVSEWSVEELVAIPGAIQRLTTGLDNGPSSAAIQYALPHLVSFFSRDAKWPRQELRALYLALLLALWAETKGGKNDLIVAMELAEGLLSLGLDAHEYGEVAELLRHILKASGSVEAVARGLELVDLMVALPCPVGGLRGMLLGDVGQLLRKYQRRTDLSQRQLFTILASELGQPELASGLLEPEVNEREAVAEPSALTALNGRSIAVYTLTQRAALQMQNLISTQAPDAKLHLLHDMDCSVRLRQLAGNVDVFIMATASATHAATNCIRSHRPKGMPLLLPAGKGVGSMLNVLLHFLESGEILT